MRAAGTALAHRMRAGMTDETKTLIAFDFGEKRIGTAIGQTVTRTATPLETIPVRGDGPDWNAIDRLIDAW